MIAENVGLSLSYGLSLNAVMFWAVYMSCFVENRMVSVERIKQFSVIPSEAAWEIKDRHPPANWPSRGNVELKDLQVTGLKTLYFITPRKKEISQLASTSNLKDHCKDDIYIGGTYSLH